MNPDSVPLDSGASCQVGQRAERRDVLGDSPVAAVIDRVDAGMKMSRAPGTSANASPYTKMKLRAGTYADRTFRRLPGRDPSAPPDRSSGPSRRTRADLFRRPGARPPLSQPPHAAAASNSLTPLSIAKRQGVQLKPTREPSPRPWHCPIPLRAEQPHAGFHAVQTSKTALPG